MTKIYEGAGQYTVYLSSGKILQLSEDDMAEINNDRISVSDFNEQVEALKNITESLETIADGVKEISDILEYTEHTEQQTLVVEIKTLNDSIIDIENTLIVAKRQSDNH